MRGSKVRGNNLGEGLGCRGDVQRLPGRCASVGKQSQLLLQPTEVVLGLQVEVEFDNTNRMEAASKTIGHLGNNM